MLSNSVAVLAVTPVGREKLGRKLEHIIMANIDIQRIKIEVTRNYDRFPRRF